MIETALIVLSAYLLLINLTLLAFLLYGIYLGGVYHPRDYFQVAFLTGVFLPVLLPYAVVRFIKGYKLESGGNHD